MLALRADYEDSYNRLSGIGDADRRLRSGVDGPEVLQTLGRLIAHHGLERVVAIRLLHRHHTVESGEAMVERLEDYRGEPALATVKTPLADVGAACIPSVWRCGRDGGIEALEYGHATLFDVQPTFFEDRRLFFAQFAAAAEELGVADFLGLCLQSRALEADEDRELLVEYTVNDFGGANVVVKRLREEGPAPENAYKTMWRWNGTVMADCRTCDKVYNPSTNQTHHDKTWVTHEKPHKEE